MTIAHLAPALLVSAENAFSLSLRARNTTNEVHSRGISLYRKIVRENITSVLQSTFPLFTQKINDDGLNEIVDMFLYQHQASQPEFHQIATELLLFMRQQCQLSAQDLALIEYEWLMYAVEIDDHEVPPLRKIKSQMEWIPEIEIQTNPTLKIVALPFLLKDGEPYYEEAACLHYFALYRKYDNAVWQKKLSETEVYLFSEMNNQVIRASSLTLFSQDTSFQSWLEVNNNDEIISLISKS